MKTLFLSFAFSFISFFYLQAQTTQQKVSFPDAWIGVWEGELQIYNKAGLAQTLPMETHISKGDSANQWNWKIVYIAKKDSPDVRPYVVIAKDAKNGLYVMDEKNTIAMESYYIGGVFWTCFDVQGTRLFTSYRMVGKNLVSEIVFGKTTAISTTGGTSEDIPPVVTYPIGGVQRCVMKKRKK